MRKLILFFLAFSLFTGCSKKDIKKWIGKSPWEQPSSVPCRIDSIYPVEKGDPAINQWTAVGVHYNSKGNPVVANYQIMHYDIVKFSVNFIYDNKDRLIEVTAPIREEVTGYFYTAPLRIKYVYEGSSPLPVRDTIFGFVGLEAAEVEDLYYDEYGRINRIVHRNNSYPWPDYYESKYYYDARGNKQVSLTGNGEAPVVMQYSDKPSLYSLHPVWRLLHKDYSINSVKDGAESYNGKGLPLKVNLPAFYNNYSGTFYNRYLLCARSGSQYQSSIISYTCSESKK